MLFARRPRDFDDDPSLSSQCLDVLPDLYEDGRGPCDDARIWSTAWAPTQELLQRHHVAVLVSHGGAASVQEALLTRTPHVVCPLFADQFDHALSVSRSGFGLAVTEGNSAAMTATLTAALNNVLTQRLKFVSTIERAMQLDSVLTGVGANASSVAATVVGLLNASLLAPAPAGGGDSGDLEVLFWLLGVAVSHFIVLFLCLKGLQRCFHS